MLRKVDLPEPEGPEIETIARNGDCGKYSFSIPKVKNNPLNFSFSGLKTALLYKCRKLSIKEMEANISNLAASYQEAILNSLLKRLNDVIDITGIERISIVGGVAANKRFRELADILKNNTRIEIYFPPVEYCTDNAAMIAMAGYEKLKNGIHSSLSLKANPNLALNDGESP